MVQLFFFFMVPLRRSAILEAQLTPRSQSTWAMWITALAPSLGMVANILPFFLVTMEAFNGALMYVAALLEKDVPR